MKRISHLGNSFRSSLAGARKDGASGTAGEDSPSSEHLDIEHGTSTMTADNDDDSPANVPTAPVVEPTLVGKAWKRRGGVAGKLSAKAPTAWELRNLQLVGSKLVYYSTDCASKSEEQEEEVTFAPDSNPASPQSQTSESSSGMGGMGSWLDKAKSTAGNVTSNLGTIIQTTTARSPATGIAEPRGSLDLKEAETRVYASFGHSGAPSPFCLSFQVGLAKETKWKLAFDTLQEQMEWLAAISTVIIQSSVDDYNGLLLRAASVQTVNQQIEGGALFVHQPSVREPPAPVEIRNTNGSKPSDLMTIASGGGAHRLWMMESYAVSYTDPYAPLTTLTKQQQAHKQELETAVQDSNKSLMLLYQQCQAQVVQLQAQIKTMKVEHATAMEAANNDMAQQSQTEETLAQDSATINVLRDAIAKLQSAHDEKLNSLTEQHRNELQRQQKEFQTQLELTKQMLDDASSAASDNDDATAKVTELESKIQEMESQIGQLQSTLEQRTVEHQHQLQSQQAGFDIKYQAILDDQKTQLESTLEERLSQNEAQVQALQSQLQALTEQEESLLGKLKAEQDQQVELQQELQTLKTELSLQLEKIESEDSGQLTALKDELTSLRAANEELTERLDVALMEEARLLAIVEAASTISASEPDTSAPVITPETNEEEEDDDDDENLKIA